MDTSASVRVSGGIVFVSWDGGVSWWAISACGTVMQRFQQPPASSEEWVPQSRCPIAGAPTAVPA